MAYFIRSNHPAQMELDMLSLSIYALHLIVCILKEYFNFK